MATDTLEQLKYPIGKFVRGTKAVTPKRIVECIEVISHGQSLQRFKLALTEEKPVIKPYKEALWAEHTDARSMPVEPSLQIIAGTHARWVVLLKSMTPTEFDKVFVHPEQNREITLSEALELYVWHSNHHMAHITGLKKRTGW